jgi:hypothetical protein
MLLLRDPNFTFESACKTVAVMTVLREMFTNLLVEFLVGQMKIHKEKPQELIGIGSVLAPPAIDWEPVLYPNQERK